MSDEKLVGAINTFKRPFVENPHVGDVQSYLWELYVSGQYLGVTVSKLQSRIEKLEKALKHYTNCHDSGCSLAYTDNCDCEFPMWAKQALEEK